ncbi:MAG: methionyl-tRNA formyltransferase, partial [Rhodocyclaceae bacterium]|nr:methionyl-tRNA formyltransferase [Rhodocyclaceae bacterium]
DTGPMLMRETLAIDPTDTTATLHDKLALLGGPLIVAALLKLDSQDSQDSLTPTPQPEAGMIYAHKIMKSEGVIDWQQPAIVLERRIRAFDPFPGCTTELQGIPLKIWKATARPASSGQPGICLQTTKEGILVACGEGALLITEAQRAGGKRMAAFNLLHGV